MAVNTKIGSGAFSTVFFDSVCAIKTYDSDEKFEASKEIEVLEKIKSNRKLFKEKFESDYGYRTKSSLITIKKWKYSPETGTCELFFKRYACNLLELMQSCSIDVITAKHIFHKIMVGLNELQFSEIIHGDLKPENVLVSIDHDIGNKKKLVNHVKKGLDPRKIIVKIIDFNKAVSFSTRIKPLDIQTLYYTPPEIILGCRDYNYSVDIWTAACILYEMISRKHLFNIYNKENCLSESNDSKISEDSEDSEESDANVYDKFKFDHLALMHMYNYSMGTVPKYETSEFINDYIRNDKLIGAVDIPKVVLYGKWCTIIDTIFERTFHYDYNNRLTIDEYFSLYVRDNKR